MKYILKLLLTIVLINTAIMAEEKDTAAITYTNIHGRLGDALVAYMRAKWISYKYHIPLLYQPFWYSSELQLHDLDLRYDMHRYKYNQELVISDLSSINVDANKTLFSLPYFSESLQEYHDLAWFQKCSWFQIDWEDKALRSLLRKFIAPKKPLKLIKMPKDKDCFTIAVHVRLGGGFDHLESAAEIWPLKFPALAWYRYQLIYVSKLLSPRNMVVYIFTDDPNPKILYDYFRAALPGKNITFAYRETGNRHDANVLEDLFSMAKCDCLIRPMSNLSFTAGVIGKATLVIFPFSYCRTPTGLVIDNTKILHRKGLNLNVKKSKKK